jgi:hypothetical protein
MNLTIPLSVIRKEIVERVPVPNTELEFEVRFDIRNKSDVGNLIRSLEKSGKPYVSKICTDKNNGGVRIRECEGSFEYIRKTKPNNWKWKQFNVTLALAIEETILQHVEPDSQNQRRKEQKIYQFSDISSLEINKVFKDKASTPKYEIELEFDVQLLKKDPRLFDEVTKTVEQIYTMMKGTNNIYSNEYETDVSQSFNKIVNVKAGPNNLLANFFIMQARNIKYSDMVNGGLTPERYEIKKGKKINLLLEKQIKESRESSYVVSLKADGERKFVYFHNTGVWLLAPPNSLNLLILTPEDIESREFELMDLLKGTILEAEMIPMENRLVGGDVIQSDKEYFLLVYDCLFLCNEDLRSLHYTDRREKMNHPSAPYVNLMNKLSPNAEFQVKEIRHFTDKKGFFEECNYLLDSNPPYLTDGLMFTPDEKYTPVIEKNHPLHTRITTYVRDVVKWKPPHHLTIDFRIVKDGTPFVKLQVTEKQMNIDFIGTNIAPYDPNIVDLESLENYPSESIVEFGFEEGKLVPRRLRIDKETPNGKNIAEGVWDDIHNPIGEDVIRGNSFVLIKKVHNRVKKKLFESILERKNKTLLDIGSGAGGDSSHWSYFKKIIVVEPNQENLKILDKRLYTTLRGSIAEKVRVVKTIGQDTKLITKNVEEYVKGKVDTISLMLSLSFFYESDEFLQSLVNTIKNNLKPDGEIIILTVDGFKLSELVSPAFSSSHVEKNEEGKYMLNLGKAKILVDETTNQVNFDLQGSIAEKQNEWLVNIDTLLLKLQEHFNINIEMFPTTQDGFLTDDEIIYSKIYSALKITMSDSSGPLTLGGLNLPQTNVPHHPPTNVPQTQGGLNLPMTGGFYNRPPTVQQSKSPVKSPSASMKKDNQSFKDMEEMENKLTQRTNGLTVESPSASMVKDIQSFKSLEEKEDNKLIEEMEDLTVESPSASMVKDIQSFKSLEEKEDNKLIEEMEDLTVESPEKSPSASMVKDIQSFKSLEEKEDNKLTQGMKDLTVESPEKSPSASIKKAIQSFKDMQDSEERDVAPPKTISSERFPHQITDSFEPYIYTFSREQAQPATLDYLIILKDDKRMRIGTLNVTVGNAQHNFKVFRIGCIAEGSCFFHAFLKAFDQNYQQISYHERKRVVANMRKEISDILPHIDYNGKSIYDNVSEKGGWGVNMAVANDARMKIKKSEEELAELSKDPIVNNRRIKVVKASINDYKSYLEMDFSLGGILNHFNSTRYVGIETIPVVETIFNINIMMIQMKLTGDIFIIEKIECKETNRPVVIILEFSSHFELIGLEDGDSIITLFSFDHPMVKYLEKYRPLQ